MCRLLGIIANREVDFKFSLFGDAQRNLRKQSELNPDGWGVAVFSEKGKVIVHKALEKASGDQLFEKIAFSYIGKIMIAHVRKASSGSNKMENTHPFRIHEWVFAHNGTIYDQKKLETYIEPSVSTKIKGDTDSERYFALILSQFARDGIRSNWEVTNLLESLTSSIQMVRDRIGGSGLNFLLSNGRDLFAYRNGRDLYYLIRDPGDIPEESFQSKETGALVSWKKAAGEKAVVVASERITESEHWQSVLNNEIICIEDDLTVRRKNVA